MKKILLALSLLVTISFSDLFAQKFLGSVFAGVNLAQIEGDDVHGFYKVGANVGAGISLPLDAKQHWTITLELMFTQKGSYKKYRMESAFDTAGYASVMFEDVNRAVAFDPLMKCKINLDYVEIPLLAHYEDHNTGWAIGAGFSWGRLVRAKEIYNGFARTTNVRSKTYSTSDWSVLVDVRARIWKGLKFGLRWSYSIAPIRKLTYVTVKTNGDTDSWTSNFHNHTISLRLMYIFNEKFVKNEKGKWTKDISKSPWDK